MPHDVLSVAWFVILAVAWAVYLALESFIVGSGMLQRFVTKDVPMRKTILFKAGLHWDGIEVWLITAVGGTFAAFPLVYATITSSLYVAFFLLLLALVVRGVTIELAYKDENPKWQGAMTLAWSISSLLIPLVLGVYFANVFLGLKLDVVGYTGSFLGLFTLPALVMGVLFVALSLVTGSAWIRLTTRPGAHHDKARRIGLYAAVVAALATIFELMALNTGSGVFNASVLYTAAPVLWAVPVLTALVALLSILFALRKSAWPVLLTGCLTFVLLLATGYIAIFPNLIPSSVHPDYAISLQAAASSQTTLQVMFVAASVFVPIVLAYQTWKFWYFSKERARKADSPKGGTPAGEA